MKLNFRIYILLVILASMLLSGCLPSTKTGAKLTGPGWQSVTKIISPKGIEVKATQDTTWTPKPYESKFGELPMPNETTSRWVYFKDSSYSYAMNVEDEKEWLSYQDKIDKCYTFYYNTDMRSGEKTVVKSSLKDVPCDK